MPAGGRLPQKWDGRKLVAWLGVERVLFYCRFSQDRTGLMPAHSSRARALVRQRPGSRLNQANTTRQQRYQYHDRFEQDSPNNRPNASSLILYTTRHPPSPFLYSG